jgi:peptide/nickel transport system ATP-binding protein
MTAALLIIRDLTISVARSEGRVTVVDDVTLELAPGGALGLVGESGSGKSLTLRAAMALLPPAARVEAGRIELLGETLPQLGPAARRARRGRVAIVFQDSLSALDPVQTAGTQIAEAPRYIGGLSRRRAWARAVELLGLVGVPDPQRRAHAFPHQLSGGLRQRVAIAIALSTDPALLLCDEPTTALDVTVQAQVLELLDDLRRRLGLGVVFVSHDLAVVRQLCDDVAVMYAGRIVERGATNAVLAQPRHPYTRGLLDAVVDVDAVDRGLRPIGGGLPEPGRLPPGCAFNPRCPLASDVCLAAVPPLEIVEGTHATACYHADLVPA